MPVAKDHFTLEARGQIAFDWTLFGMKIVVLDQFVFIFGGKSEKGM